MEVTVHDPEDGGSCVVQVGPGDTVADLQAEAIRLLHGPTEDGAVETGHYTMRIRGGDDVMLGDATPVADTPLEHGSDVDLVASVTIRAPCRYRMEGITDIALSPCDMLCAVSTTQRLALWATPRAVQVAEHPLPSFAVAFSSAGHLAVAVELGTVVVLDPLSGCRLAELAGHREVVRACRLSWSPCGRCLVSGTLEARDWDVPGGRCALVLEGHTEMLTGVASTRDKIVTSSQDTTVRVWQREDGFCVMILPHCDIVNDVVVTPDEQHVISAGGPADTTLRVWSLETGATVRVLRGSSAYFYSLGRPVTVNGSTWLASATGDSSIIVWDADTGSRMKWFGRGGVMNTRGLLSSCGRFVFFCNASSVTVVDAFGSK